MGFHDGIVQFHSEAGGGILTDDDRKAIARRLVTCWNACDGIPTEALEAEVVVERLKQATLAAIAKVTGE
jgi:hypothetical protein